MSEVFLFKNRTLISIFWVITVLGLGLFIALSQAPSKLVVYFDHTTNRIVDVDPSHKHLARWEVVNTVMYPGNIELRVADAHRFGVYEDPQFIAESKNLLEGVATPRQAAANLKKYSILAIALLFAILGPVALFRHSSGRQPKAEIG